MNKRVILMGIVCTNLIASISTNANQPQLAARPVVFIDSRKAFSYPPAVSGSLEWIDLQKKINDLRKTCGEWSEELTKFTNDGRQELEKKLTTAATDIAKQLGACALIQVDADQEEVLYYDPAYDVTREAIDILNKSYTPVAKTSSQQNPQDLLLEAIMNDSPEEISQALRAGANINHGKSGELPLCYAVRYKRSNAVKCLLQCGAKATNILFQEALKLNDIKSAVLLAINCGANLNAVYSNGYTKNTLLQLAFTESNLDFESVLLLVKSGASFSGYTIIKIGNRPERTLMGITVSHCEQSIGLELIQRYINNGYKVDDIWYGDLNTHYEWLYKGNIQALEIFIKNGANPNQIIQNKYQKDSSWTPLHAAIDCRSLQAVKMLLKAGANINQKANPYPNRPPLCPDGAQTPLAFAINSGATAIADFLRGRGASL